MYPAPTTNYRFSGHETFPIRYPWLPKAVAGLKANPHLFKDEDQAIVELGVGKNMVKAMRFWIEATGFVRADGKNGLAPTVLGEALLGDEGLDPFLEDIQTLWIMHWNISTQLEAPLFAWDFLFNRWQEAEISEQAVLRAFAQEAEKLARKLSAVTLKQHFDIFLHTYLPTRGNRGDVNEDNLDCPLTELELLAMVGERTGSTSKREIVYAFRREDKPSISTELFAWALNDFWQKRFPNEMTLPVHSIATGLGGPGQIFKIPEADVLARLGDIESATNGALRYQESASIPQVQRARTIDSMALLHSAFKRRITHA